MTDQQPPEPRQPSDPPPEQPETIVVPGNRGSRARDEPYDDLEPETVVIEARDVGSASRSCLAIVVLLIVIALMLCVFFVAQLFV